LKALYVIILFLVLFNVFCFIGALFIPYGFGTAGASYGDIDIADPDNPARTPSEVVFRKVSQQDFSSIIMIFFGNVESILILGGTALASYITSSPAPLVVGFLSTVMLATYKNSISVFEQFEINNILMLAGLVGMVILILVTCAEILTHGDA